MKNVRKVTKRYQGAVGAKKGKKLLSREEEWERILAALKVDPKEIARAVKWFSQ